MQGHFERPPYNSRDIRSVYHVREFEVRKLLQLSAPLDVFVSHDWPRGVTKHGNEAELLRRKPFFREEVRVFCLQRLAASYETYIILSTSLAHYAKNEMVVESL